LLNTKGDAACRVRGSIDRVKLGDEPSSSK
jgi:hypothetical protein